MANTRHSGWDPLAHTRLVTMIVTAVTSLPSSMERMLCHYLLHTVVYCYRIREGDYIHSTQGNLRLYIIRGRHVRGVILSQGFFIRNKTTP